MNESAKVTGNIEVVGNCAYYRPAGKLTLEEAVDLVDQTIAYVRGRRIPKLLFSAKNLVGFRSPSLPERYFTARQWAATSQSLVQVAMVIRADYIDPQKFGVTVALNAGMTADVFAEESEALAWLLGDAEK